MQKKLVPSGTGWELYMPKDVLKLLGFDPKSSQVIFKMDGNILKISKATQEEIASENRLVKKFNKSGNGYGLYISNSIIQFLEINPETDSVKYVIRNDVLYISGVQIIKDD